MKKTRERPGIIMGGGAGDSVAEVIFFLMMQILEHIHMMMRSSFVFD